MGRSRFKYNQNGKGYRYKAGTGFVTTFEERVLFIKKSSIFETGEKSQPPKVEGTIKRKFDRSEAHDDNDSTKEIENNAKRIKNENNFANNPGEDDEETSVEESLFSNDLLLRTIFSNLEVEDLKSCRLVKSLWNLEATKILLKRDCFKAIEISDDTVTILDTAEYKRPTALQDFRNIFANSKLFPCTSFAVNNNELSVSAVNFFRENGHLIKSFCFLEPPFPIDDVIACGVILLAAISCPNLKKLLLASSFDDPVDAIILLAIERAPDWTNLHTLEVTQWFSPDVVSLILKKASNLQNIFLHPGNHYRHPYFSELDKLVKLDNVIPRLRNIYLQLSNDALKIYRRVLKQKPQFLTIEAIDTDGKPLNIADGAQFLTEMFHQCSESLTEILDIKGLHKIPGVNFPVFPNVKRLEMQFNCLRSLVQVNMPKVFPNLATIKIECCQVGELIPGPFVPLLSVRHLQMNWGYYGNIPGDSVNMMCSLFPNVTSAKFCHPLSGSAYECIWKLSKLRDLHLEIRSRSRESCFLLDSAFTGFSYEMVENLYKIAAGASFNLSAEEVKSARIKPSIVELKELRKLSLRLWDATVREGEVYIDDNRFGEKNVNVVFDSDSDDKALLKVDGEIILSRISKRFGFDLCPRLNSNVSVGFTHYTKLYTETESDDSESE